MRNHHSIIGEQSKQSQALVSIYIDLQNAKSIKHLGSLLLEFAKFQGILIEAKVYYNSLCPIKSLQ